MDALSHINSAGQAISTGLGVAQVAADDFFKFISAQLSNQDPLEPVDETQFMGQIAQYAQLDEAINTNANLQALAVLQDSIAGIQQMTDGAQLIGQTVEYTDFETGEEHSGLVEAVRLEDGIVVLDLGEEQIPLTWMTAVVSDTVDDS